MQRLPASPQGLHGLGFIAGWGLGFIGGWGLGFKNQEKLIRKRRDFIVKVFGTAPFSFCIPTGGTRRHFPAKAQCHSLYHRNPKCRPLNPAVNSKPPALLTPNPNPSLLGLGNHSRTVKAHIHLAQRSCEAEASGSSGFKAWGLRVWGGGIEGL